MNPYHDAHPEERDPTPHDAVLLSEHACQGTLTRDVVFDLIGGCKGPWGRLQIRREWGLDSSSEEIRAACALRPAFCRLAAWSVYTTAWLDGLAKQILDTTGQSRPTVLEVGAGRGLLRPLMAVRGIDWVCTEAVPPRRLYDWHPPLPVQREALEAQAAIGHDALFWSWWPYTDATEVTLAERAVAAGVPVWFVGEGCGGCTGVMATWNRSEWNDGDDAPPPNHPWTVEDAELAEDVPQWDGLHDETFRIIGCRGGRP